MKADNLLLVLLASGVVVTVLYLVNEFLSWRSLKAFEQRARIELRELYKRVHASAKPRIIRAMRRK